MRILDNNQVIPIENILPKVLTDVAVRELAKNEQESFIDRLNNLNF